MKARVHNIHRFLEEYPLEATQKQKLVCETVSANLVRGERSAGRGLLLLLPPARPSVAYLSSARQPAENGLAACPAGKLLDLLNL